MVRSPSQVKVTAAQILKTGKATYPIVGASVDVQAADHNGALISVVEAGSIPSAMSERGENQLLTLVWIAIGFLILIVPLMFLQRWAERRTAVA